MPRSGHLHGQRYFLRFALVAAGVAAGFGAPFAAQAADAPSAPAAVAQAAPPAASASDIADLRAQVEALKAKLDLLESQQAQQAKMALDQQTKAAAEAAKPKKPQGAGVHIVETSGTDVKLYGLIEATLSGQTAANSAGAGAIGLPVSWFSGNRWGLDVNQKLSSGPNADADNKLNLIVKLESEFELPSGNMDTPGVLFNRDAWIGFQSKDFGKLTIGRQDTLPRDVTGTWGDPYSSHSDINTDEGNYTNTNNFKQFIFYTSGGNGAGGQGDTRYDSALVYKKVFDNGLFIGVGYNFGDANGPGGPNGSGPINGAQFNKGSSEAVGLGLNAGRVHLSTFYNTTNVLEVPTIGSTNIGHQDQSVGVGGNYDMGTFRINAGFIDYTGDQGALGQRNDKAWTVSTKIAPTKHLDYELGLQEFYAHNAALSGSGYILRPYIDATGATATASGSRFTAYGSIITHPMSNVDIYLAGDDLLTGGGYLDSRAHGFKHENELATGVRYKF